MNEKLRNKNLRIIAAVLCACIAAFLALSFAYEIKEANHDCTGHDCPICACIQSIENSRQQLSFAGVTFGICVVLLIRVMATVLSYVVYFCANSPVRLKVKLND